MSLFVYSTEHAAAKSHFAINVETTTYPSSVGLHRTGAAHTRSTIEKPAGFPSAKDGIGIRCGFKKLEGHQRLQFKGSPCPPPLRRARTHRHFVFTIRALGR